MGRALASSQFVYAKIFLKPRYWHLPFPAFHWATFHWKKENNLFWETQKSCFSFPFVHPYTQSDYLIILVQNRAVSAAYFIHLSFYRRHGGNLGWKQTGQKSVLSFGHRGKKVDLHIVYTGISFVRMPIWVCVLGFLLIWGFFMGGVFLFLMRH